MHAMRNGKRPLGLLLAALLGLALCACGPAPTPSPPPDVTPSAVPLATPDPYAGLEKRRFENAYTAAYIDLKQAAPAVDGEILNETVNSVFELPEKLVFQCEYVYTTTENGAVGQGRGIRLYETGLDGSGCTLAGDYRPEQTAGETSRSTRETNHYLLCPDGSRWYYALERAEDWSDPLSYKAESRARVVHEAADGAELLSIDLAELDPETPNVLVQAMLLCDGGELLVYNAQRLYVLSPEGELLHTVPLDTLMLNKLVKTGGGDVVFWSRDRLSGETGLQRLDIAGGTLEALGPLPTGSGSNLMGGAGSTVLLSTPNAILRYDYETGAQTELLNWLHSDVNISRVMQVFSLSDGRFVYSEMDGSFHMAKLALLTRVPDEDVAEKYVVKLAALSLDEKLRDAIIGFNRQSELFRIEHLDYGGGSFQEGMRLLDLDIAAGKTPDLLALRQLPLEKYAANGVLAELGPLLDGEEGFDRAEYLENILCAGSFRGRQYSVIPFFFLDTVAGKSELVGDAPGWNMEGLLALTEQHPDSAVFDHQTVKSALWQLFGRLALARYMNPDAGTCGFNTPAFRQTLAFIGGFPDSFDLMTFYQDPASPFFSSDYQTRFQTGGVLLYPSTLTGYRAYQNLLRTFGGEATLIGFPTPEGVGEAIQPLAELGIGANSRLQAVCLDFLRYLLSPEMQAVNDAPFPVRRSALADMAAAAMDPASYPEADAAAPGPNAYVERPLTHAQLAHIDAALEAAAVVQRDNALVLAILEEEAGAYFAGAKSEAETAELIQSRVQLHLQENG